MNTVFEQAMADLGKIPDETPTTSQSSTNPVTGSDGIKNKGRRTNKVGPIDDNRKSGEEDKKKQGKILSHMLGKLHTFYFGRWSRVSCIYLYISLVFSGFEDDRVSHLTFHAQNNPFGASKNNRLEWLWNAFFFELKVNNFS